jgi:hypothetical protein
MILVWLIAHSAGDSAMHNRALEIFNATIPGNQRKKGKG